MKSIRAAVLLALPFLLSACATPTLQSPTSDPAAVAREAAIQRKYVIERKKAQWGRVSRVMFHLNVGAAELCKDNVSGVFGLAGMTAGQFGSEYENVAREEFGFADVLTVTAVFPGSPAEIAGLLPGDRIISFGTSAATSANQAGLIRANALNRQAVSIQYRRGAETRTASAVPVLACNYPAHIEENSAINAWADGQVIAINTGMLSFVSSDEELAVAVSHELSHNILDHMGKKKENAVVGTAIGLAADILIIAATGVNPRLYRAGARIGAQAYSVEFEQEADYEGLYLMRRAGYRIQDAANFWRRMAAEHPDAITMRSDHPTTPERFLALNKAVAEIEVKEAQRLALVPDLRPGKGDSNVSVASTSPGIGRTAFIPASAGRESVVTLNSPREPTPKTFSGVSIANLPFPLGIKSSGEVTGASIAAVYMGKDPHGIAIGALEPNGSAAKAGARVGDVIVSFNGKRIETLDDLKSLISKATSPEAKMELNRSGKILPLNLHL